MRTHRSTNAGAKVQLKDSTGSNFDALAAPEGRAPGTSRATNPTGLDLDARRAPAGRVPGTARVNPTLSVSRQKRALEAIFWLRLLAE